MKYISELEPTAPAPASRAARYHRYTDIHLVRSDNSLCLSPHLVHTRAYDVYSVHNVYACADADADAYAYAYAYAYASASASAYAYACAYAYMPVPMPMPTPTPTSVSVREQSRHALPHALPGTQYVIHSLWYMGTWYSRPIRTVIM